MNNPTIKLLKELSKHRAKLFIVMIAIGCVSGSMLSVGHIIRTLIDNGISPNNIDALNSSIIKMIIAILVLGGASFFRSFYINHISHQVVADLRIRIYKTLLFRPVEYFDSMKISDCMSRFSYDLHLVGEIITNILSFTIRNIFMFIGGMTMMFVQNIKLSLITIAVFPIIMIFFKLIGIKIKKFGTIISEDKASLEEIISETLNNIKIIYALGIENYRLNKLLSQSNKTSIDTKKYIKIRALFFATAIFTISFLLIIVIWIGGMDVLNNSISPGNMVSFIFYSLLTAFSIGGVAEVFGEIQKHLVALDRIFELDSISKKQIPHKTPENLTTLFNLTFMVKNFSYPTRPNVEILKDISINVSGGEFIGIVGPSGSGKSTILQLIMGIYNNKSSSLSINNHKVDISLNELLRSKIAYIPQDPFLFSTTIEENITLGRDFGPIDKIITICGLNNMIKSLPEGINTYVGERGTRLSGGQKQRIAIARSIYANPEILLMDEATSALDTKSEIALLGNLRKYMQGKIIIAVAHRLSSIMKADKVLFVHNGEIIAADSHENLLKTSPLYANLMNQ